MTVPISGYQVEWLINQRRRWLGLVRMVERGWRSLGDRVELSIEGSEQARRLPGRPPRLVKVPRSRTGDVGPADLAERESRGPVVDYELERRAGSFLRPPYPSFPSPAKIPRVRRKEEDEQGALARPTGGHD